MLRIKTLRIPSIRNLCWLRPFRERDTAESGHSTQYRLVPKTEQESGMALPPKQSQDQRPLNNESREADCPQIASQADTRLAAQAGERNRRRVGGVPAKLRFLRLGVLSGGPEMTEWPTAGSTMVPRP